MYFFQNGNIHSIHCLLLLIVAFGIPFGFLSKIFQSAYIKPWIIKTFKTSVTENTVILSPLYVCDNIGIFSFSDILDIPGLALIDVKQYSKHFRNLYFNRGSSVDENGTSRQSCCTANIS